jgi:hypothetical protein
VKKKLAKFFCEYKEKNYHDFNHKSYTERKLFFEKYLLWRLCAPLVNLFFELTNSLFNGEMGANANDLVGPNKFAINRQ